MADVVVLMTVAVLVGFAFGFLWKEKKKGAKCLGCPFAGTCSKKNADSNCTH